MDQGSTRKRSAVHNFAPTVTKFCVMWEGQALPHDTKFSNSRCEIVGRRVIFIWSLIHGSSWSGLIKVGPGNAVPLWYFVLLWSQIIISHKKWLRNFQESDMINPSIRQANFLFIRWMTPHDVSLGGRRHNLESDCFTHTRLTSKWIYGQLIHKYDF